VGAREDLLGAAERLTERGRSPFSPAELIAEARSGGSNYPDSTLRTFIVGPMCVNSPDNHAVQYGDLFRVGRGLYRLAAEAERGTIEIPERASAVAPVARLVEAPHEAWFWEGNVQATVVRHLASEGWHIRRVADTASRERGIDIEADRDGDRLLVEVKGYPASTYASGERAGETKRTSAPLQARAYFSHALLTGVLMRSDHDEAHVVIAFPEMETYATLARRTVGTLASAGIEVWLVAQDGQVRHVDPE
jgi:hypothetical protein